MTICARLRLMLLVLLSQCSSASDRVAVYARAMTGTGSSAVEGSLTVDELAARTGMTVRTVRFYATEGLLPAPERRGRIAYYGAPHRMRLDLIRTLQDHGYTLAAIERVLARIPHDALPAEYAVQSAEARTVAARPVRGARSRGARPAGRPSP